MNNCIEFYEKNGRKPSQYSINKVEKNLGFFWNRNLYKKLSQWQIALLSKIPTFFDKKESVVNKFYRMAVIYRERYGHTNIKWNDTIDGYKIGSVHNTLIQKYQNNKLTKEEVAKLRDIGIKVNVSKTKQKYDRKMRLSQKALNEGVIISTKNQIYEGENLYEWYQTNKNKYSKEELKIMNKLIAHSKKPIIIKDIKSGEVYSFPSISDANKVLYSFFEISDGNTQKTYSAIQRRLSGKVTSPYKGRFHFEYANSEKVSKSCKSGEDKVS